MPANRRLQHSRAYAFEVQPDSFQYHHPGVESGKLLLDDCDNTLLLCAWSERKFDSGKLLGVDIGQGDPCSGRPNLLPIPWTLKERCNIAAINELGWTNRMR